jgi:hypothetical protein
MIIFIIFFLRRRKKSEIKILNGSLLSAGGEVTTMLADSPPPVHKLPLHMWVQEARLGNPLRVAHLEYPLRTACGFVHCFK